jgi:glycosyltransferase involved in cell wall biosynthesis
LGFVDIDKIFAQTSICILPARYDAFPLIAAEASMNGIIPLVSNRVGTKEILAKVDPNLIVDFENIDQWVERIETYLTCSQKTRENLYLGLKARFEILTEENVLKRYKATIDKLRGVYSPP